MADNGIVSPKPSYTRPQGGLFSYKERDKPEVISDHSEALEWREGELNEVRQAAFDRAIEAGANPTNAKLAVLALDVLPGVGDVLAALDVVKSFEEKDYLGAGINVAALGLGVVPVVGRQAGRAIKKGAKKLRKGLVSAPPFGRVKATKAEEKWFNEILSNKVDREELLEYVPSFKMEGDNISVNPNDMDAFSKYIDDSIILDGPGTVPPRLKKDGSKFWADIYPMQTRPEPGISPVKDSSDFNFQKGGTNMANTEEFNDDAELTGLISEPTDVDPVSGNEIPLGATAEGVRDDQTADISPGEFVIPDYAVRYHGLDFYVGSLQKAKQGLDQMEGMGLVGNPDDQTIPDETPLPTMTDEEPEFQTGGYSPVPLPQTPQQQAVPTMPLPKAPAIQPIRPVSTQPVPPLQVPTSSQVYRTPLGLDTSQYQQGYYIEASPGLYQLKGPPGMSTTMGLVPLDQLNPQFKVAPPGTRYEDVFGGVSRGSLQKTTAGTPQSLYEQFQGEAAGGYRIEPFINDAGNMIYLTTVMGSVQGGTPPGYRKASPEETGQTRRDTPAQAPVVTPRRQPQLPDVGGGGEEIGLVSQENYSSDYSFTPEYDAQYAVNSFGRPTLTGDEGSKISYPKTDAERIAVSFQVVGLKAPFDTSLGTLGKKALGAAFLPSGLAMNVFSAIKDHSKQPSIANTQMGLGMQGSMVEGNLSTHSIASLFGKNITVAYDALNPTRDVSVAEVQAARASRLGVNWTNPAFKEENYTFSAQGIAVAAGSNPTFSAMFAIDEDGNLVKDGVGGVGFRSGGTNAKGQGVNSDGSISAAISVGEFNSMTPQAQAEHAAARNGIDENGIKSGGYISGVRTGLATEDGRNVISTFSATLGKYGGEDGVKDVAASLSPPSKSGPEAERANEAMPTDIKSAMGIIDAAAGADAAADPCVICAELHAQNKISDEVNLFDQAFGAKIEQTDYYALVGYQFWARYVVKLMKKSSLFSSFVYFVTKPWVTEMSSIMSDRKLKGSIVGKIIMKFGIPICRMLGEHLEGAVTCQFKKI